MLVCCVSYLCAQLQAPVWEHTASLVENFSPKVRLAKVDCTDPNSEELCMQNHIQAYPTVIIFTSVNGVHTHEFYHGQSRARTKLHSVADHSACRVRLFGVTFSGVWGAAVVGR